MITGNYGLLAISTALSDWRTLQGLRADGSFDQANPSGDGIKNIIRFAYNLAPTSGALNTPSLNPSLPAGGNAGLPSVSTNPLLPPNFSPELFLIFLICQWSDISLTVLLSSVFKTHDSRATLSEECSSGQVFAYPVAGQAILVSLGTDFFGGALLNLTDTRGGLGDVDGNDLIDIYSGGVVVNSTIGFVLGQAYAISVAIDFDATGPGANLALSVDGVLTSTTLVTTNGTFRELGFYGGNQSNRSSVDNIKLDRIVTSAGFAQWKIDNGLPAGTPPNDDFDFDGVSDLVEYALGTLPNNASSAGRPLLSREAGTLKVFVTAMAFGPGAHNKKRSAIWMTARRMGSRSSKRWPLLSCKGQNRFKAHSCLASC